MVPVKVDGNDPGSLFSDIFDDRKIVIFNPLHSHVHHLSGNAMALEKVGQSKKPHGQKVNPHKIVDRPVIIGQLGDMEKNKVKSSHWGNCKMLTRDISTSSKKLALE
jgi:hypothetical protein